jgi:hypothetical protein
MSSEYVARLLDGSRWVGAQIAKAQVALRNGASKEDTSRILYEMGPLTLKRSREIVENLRDASFESFLEKRKNLGSAGNPITKLFPAAVTERQFLDELDFLKDARKTIDYHDERFKGHTLVDFTVIEGGDELPINVKNAGTRFENAAKLVGLDPDDCIPIPTYKAYEATEKEPNLLYIISIDYLLSEKIEKHMFTLLSSDEMYVWNILSLYSGPFIRDAEDKFIYSIVNRYWDNFSTFMSNPAFQVISARKAIHVLHKNPRRTPGLGLRAWGTSASAEVNVHVSVNEETKKWEEIQSRIVAKGIVDIISAVNRKKAELVFAPEV